MRHFFFRSLSVCFFLCVVLSSHASLPWNGTASAPTATGSVYNITTPEELAWVAKQSATNDFAGFTFSINDELDMASNGEWIAIGSEDKPFQGTVLGNCNAIVNVLVYSKDSPKTNYGLFGVLGENAVVQDLAITGRVAKDRDMHSNYENIGTFAGTNKGRILRCFSMAEVSFTDGKYIGGLVGSNEGTIENSYNVGGVFGNQFVGGIAGKNSGKINNSYNVAYVSGTSAYALVGENSGDVINCYYDHKMTPENAYSGSVDGRVETEGMYSVFATNSDYYTTDTSYPQLVCFHAKNPDLSNVSVAPLILNDEDFANQQVANDITFGTDEGAVWTVNEELEDLIVIKGKDGEVKKDCNGSLVYTTATINNYSKKVYFNLDKFDPFSAGAVAVNIPEGSTEQLPSDTICQYDSEALISKVVKAEGGKDDELEKDYPYYYKFEYYDQDPTLNPTAEPFAVDSAATSDDFTLGTGRYHYKDLRLRTDQVGKFYLKAFAHDSKCFLTYQQALRNGSLSKTGVYCYYVTEAFDAGAIGGDTIIYGMPDKVTLKESVAATGGKKPYKYKIVMRTATVDAQTHDTIWTNQGEWDKFVEGDHGGLERFRGKVVADNLEEAEYDFIPTAPGNYFFMRRAKDSKCVKEGYEFGSGERFHVIIYEVLNVGQIPTATQSTCGLPFNYTITETVPVTGGSENYQYRWLIDGEVIEGANAASLDLSTINDLLATNKTYIFTREVKDDTNFTDWKASEGQFTLNTFDAFNAGEIESDTTFVLGTLPYTATGLNVTAVSGGQAPYDIQWKIMLHNDIHNVLIESNVTLSGESADDLSGYLMSTPGIYTLKRRARDQQCTKWAYEDAIGQKTFVVLDSLKGGTFDTDTMRFCETTMILSLRESTSASGGDENYKYQWFRNGVQIDGATDVWLNVDASEFKQGDKYVYTRQVTDGMGKFGKVWTEGEIVIEIYMPFDAGEILTPATQLVCTEPDSPDDLVFTATELTAASGDGGEFHYRWMLLRATETDTVLFKSFNEDAKETTLTLTASEYSGVRFPATFVLRREAQNPLCNAAWQQSKGQVIVTVAKKEYVSQTLTACREEFPLSGTVTLTNGSTKAYTVTAPDEVVTIEDVTADGCSRIITITGKAVLVPEISVDALGKLCMENNELNIPFTVLSGAPDRYRLTFDERLNRNDTIKGEIAADQTKLTITDLGDIPKGDYNLYIEFYRSDDVSGCVLNKYPLQFSYLLAGYIYQKWNDLLFVDNNRAILKPGQIETAHKFVSYQWYKDGQPIAGATEQFYYPGDGNLSSGDYSVVLVDEDGTEYQTCDFNVNKAAQTQMPNLFAGDEQTMQFYTITGQLLAEKPTATGTYILQMRDMNGQVKTVKFFIR